MRSARKYRSLLGISIDERRLTAAVLRRTGRGIEVRQSLSAGMALDPLSNDPELVGGEIRNVLTEAGIREKHCVLCLPLKRALTMQTSLPELSESDMKSFIQLQAEREFPLPLEHLSLSVLRDAGSNGTRHAIVAGILTSHLEALLKALRNAGLRPVGVTFGVTSIGDGKDATGQPKLRILVWDGSLDLAVQDGHSLYTLRSLADIATYEQGHPEIHVEALAKQLRITLGQLDPLLLSRIRSAEVFGPSRAAEGICRELEPYAKRMGLTIEPGDIATAVTASPEVLEVTSPALLSAAAGYLNGQVAEIEFLPKRSNPIQRILKKATRRSAVLPAGIALAVVLVLAGLFVYQHMRVTRLRSQWRAIETKYTDLASLLGNVRQYRPWFDDSIQSLLIARSLTEAFPEEGAVWVKELHIRSAPESDGLLVTCIGKARSEADRQRMVDRLRARPGVIQPRFLQRSGTNPYQFSISFLWKEGAENGQ
jgi:hypothetical protein